MPAIAVFEQAEEATEAIEAARKSSWDIRAGKIHRAAFWEVIILSDLIDDSS